MLVVAPAAELPIFFSNIAPPQGTTLMTYYKEREGEAQPTPGFEPISFQF